MKRKGLAAAVAALAVSSMMAAMAFNGGYIHNEQAFTVSATNNSLVALSSPEMVGNKDLTASLTDNGRMRFDFGKGIDGKMFGLQPGSNYVWNDLFDVTNNSKEDVQIRLTTDGNVGKYVTFTATVDGKSVVTYAPNGQVGYITIPSGHVAHIKADAYIHGAQPTSSLTGSVVVNTQAK